MFFNESVEVVKNVGEQRCKKLNKLGIYTVLDLIEYFPRDYDDRSNVKKIAELTLDEVNTFKGIIAFTPEVIRIKTKYLTKVKIFDDTGEIEAIWFNQPYLKNSLKVKGTYIFTGKIVKKYAKQQVESPDFEYIDEKELLSNGRIVPIYSTTSGLSQKILRACIKLTLDNMANRLTEFLPEKIRKDYCLCDRNYAVLNIHFPESNEAFFLSRRRLVFEELFLLQMKLLQVKGIVKSKKNEFCLNNTETDEIRLLLGFDLTEAQENVFKEILEDLKSDFVMNRLIQGDVGSGKTAVAMLATFVMIKNGYQVVLMAPTDVLAEQHYKYFSEIFGQLKIKCVLLSGGLKAKEKRRVYDCIETGYAKMIIGTHAVIQPAVKYDNLGLVITDEQHRFGVKQRGLLTMKGNNPHVLVMTATPIPRTLALILYGDLDISIINKLPPNRKKVDTFFVNTSYYDRIYDFIKKHIEEGRQAYIICPMIEENDKSELKAVISYTEKLSEEIFPNFKVSCVHGKMKNNCKQEIMESFSKGETDILVSTTVIEVGINVPNATVMLIENAERFGLAQLHQLRGRVGRGSEKSYCILVSDAKNKVAKERMKVMTASNDGFAISEKDLELRGPGDFFGTRQHGLPEMKIANLYKDIDILKEVQKAAQELYITDELLKNEDNLYLKKEIERFFNTNETITDLS